MDIVTFFSDRPEMMYIMAALFVFGRLLKAYPKIKNNWIPTILMGISIVINLLVQFQQGTIPPWTLSTVSDVLLQGIITSALTVGVFVQYKDTFRAVRPNATPPGTGHSEEGH